MGGGLSSKALRYSSLSPARNMRRRRPAGRHLKDPSAASTVVATRPQENAYGLHASRRQVPQGRTDRQARHAEPGLLQSTATKLAGLAAGFFAIAHFTKAALAGEPAQAIDGVGPAIAAVLALLMIWKRWYRADIVLIVAVVALTVLFKFSVEETSDPTLVAVALVVTVGALLMPESWKWPYVWLGGLLLLTMTAYWNGISTETVWTGMAAALTGVSMMILLLKLRDGLAASHRRYQVLVERLPVPLIEQDWSRVRCWLEERRREGVTDIGAYLDSHPEQLIDAMGQIRVRGVNPAITGLVGQDGPKRGIDQETAYRITRESMAPYVRQEIIGIWEDTGPIADDYVMAHDNGTEFWTRLEAAEIEEGSIPGVDRVIVATDVTELKRTQAKLGEQLRSKDEFIAAVSHELRTPLTSVLGFAELMQQDVERLTTGQHDMLGQIASQAGKWLTLLRTCWWPPAPKSGRSSSSRRRSP